jgi:hypothetical protein
MKILTINDRFARLSEVKLPVFSDMHHVHKDVQSDMCFIIENIFIINNSLNTNS